MYGDYVYGLLGMSFLSGFDVTIDANSVKLSSRKLRMKHADTDNVGLIDQATSLFVIRC